MSRRLRTLIAVVVAGVTLACASSGGGNKGVARVRPPELLSRSRPDLVAVGVTPNAPRPRTVVELEVSVKPDGMPDMNTLKITGQGASANRAAVTTWVQGLRFRPATQEGVPVVGTYKESFSVMTRTVRVR